jgi:mannose-binding lectin 1
MSNVKVLYFTTLLSRVLQSCLFFLLVGLIQAQQQAQQQGGQQQAQVYRRFEYKHSFRVPNLSQRDGTVPFWTVLGDAQASGEQLRLAPSMRSRKGAAWNKRVFFAANNPKMIHVKEL